VSSLCRSATTVLSKARKFSIKPTVCKSRRSVAVVCKGIISGNGACSPRPPNADRVIIVVSDSLIFPEGTDREPVSPREHRNALAFHVRFSDSLFYTKYSFPILLSPLS
jgi:hypothetical protein